MIYIDQRRLTDVEHHDTDDGEIKKQTSRATLLQGTTRADEETSTN